MLQKLKPISLIFLTGIVCTSALNSCSKKIIYAAPEVVSRQSISNVSVEKEIAFSYLTVPRYESKKMDALLSDSFFSFDQKWGGKKAEYISKRNSDKSFSRIQPIRILQDDSLVAVHSRMYGDTLRFRWDIFRIKEQKIQEHWSNVQDSIGLNPDGHTEIDGPTIPEQLENTDINRDLIRQFMDQCMIREDGGARKFFNFSLYIQHNRDVGDGVNGLLWGMYKMKRAGQVIKFKNNYHVISEGNFVLSATEGYVADEKTAFFDLFRMEDGRIVEHWDIITPVNHFLTSIEQSNK